jgi:aarF domain-containing kinase
MSRELKEECDYEREAAAGEAFGKLLEGDERFSVPKVAQEASTSVVLTTEMMRGTPLGRARIEEWSQERRDQIGTDILRLCLRELLHFRLMQTDPNWTNFLWNEETKKVR